MIYYNGINIKATKKQAITFMQAMVYSLKLSVDKGEVRIKPLPYPPKGRAKIGMKKVKLIFGAFHQIFQ